MLPYPTGMLRYRVLHYPSRMLRYRYRYPPGRPGYPAEGWVVFLNATWYENAWKRNKIIQIKVENEVTRVEVKIRFLLTLTSTFALVFSCILVVVHKLAFDDVGYDMAQPYAQRKRKGHNDPAEDDEKRYAQDGAA